MNSHKQKSINILNNLKYPNSLFAAARKDVSTGYNAVWIRDNIYSAMGLEVLDAKEAVKTYRAMIDILLKHEWKIDYAIKEKPDVHFKYIHPRYNPENMDEFHEHWGNKQNDAIGALLFKIGELERKKVKVLRGEDDRRIVQKLVRYLQSVEYWHDKDNGIWEENEEIHASSVGACVAGLKAIRILVDVPEWMIEKGVETLNSLLPRESETKEVDLALLSLIYPYNIVSEEQRKAILKNVEERLVREKGVIRYLDDQYYNNGGEAQWCFGFPWLAKIYKELQRPDQYAHYMRKTIEVMNNEGEIPELYYANSDEYNENCPLGWAQAMFLVALV